MNKLFLTTAFALLLALAASAAASYWLALNPVFKVDSQLFSPHLEDAGQLVFETLQPLPEKEWDTALDQLDVDDYFIDWYEANEFEINTEDRSTLFQDNQVAAELADGTPVLEILFAEQEMLLEVIPQQGYDKRYILNLLLTVTSVLLIGLLAAMLTLAPIARRLRQLQKLSNSYSDGNLQARNTDTADDAIGRLGGSMESMADRVNSLLDEKQHLVNDQQDLMRAVAHEFRAPMSRMRFALEMHDGTGEFPDESKNELGFALDDLDSLVTEVLRYARLQRSAPDLQTTQVRLTNLLLDSVTAVQAIRPEVIVQVNGPHKDVQVTVDPVQIQRALQNVLSNALKYTSDQVVLTFEKHNDELAIHIDDNGPGIRPEHRKRILEPFVRIDSSRTRSLGGTGLGLAIVNGVMVKHGGRIEISDSPVGGARFSMFLPTGKS